MHVPLVNFRTLAIAAVTAVAGFAQTQDGGLIRSLDMLLPSDATPQTSQQRFQDYALSTVGPFAIVSEAASAGLGQWRDSPREWGQGGSGYGKRFANDMAYNAVRTTITYGLAEVLHEDNRYFASNQDGFKSRILYALESPAMSRRNGRRTVSISSLTGMVGVSCISLAWAPPSWQGADNAAQNFALTYVGIAGFNVIREFVPDLIRKLRK